MPSSVDVAITRLKKNFTSLLIIFIISIGLVACSSEPEKDIFLKADPAVGSQLERRPRTLRVFLARKPDVSKSNLKLTGPRGEEELTRFHTMGADDLMIEIKSHPIPDGKYKVEWEAMIEGDKKTYNGEYFFSLKAK